MRSLRSVFLALVPLAALSACGDVPDSGDDLEPEAEGAVSPDPIPGSVEHNVAFQLPGRDFRRHPPTVTSMQLFPADPVEGRPTARLEVRYAEKLPSQIKFLHDGTPRTLRDDGQSPDSLASDGIYSSLIPVDAGLSSTAATELGEPDWLAELAGLPPGGGKGLVVPVHARPSGTGPRPIYDSSAFLVNPEKALLIRHTSVVNNSGRTKDPCLSTSADDAKKKWTFGYLLTQMANETKTKVSPSKFATEWLKSWSAKEQYVNADSVRPVGEGSVRKVGGEILRQWRCKSGMNTCCGYMPLDEDRDFDPQGQTFIACEKEAKTKSLKMNKAPFRLLAIVNRLDLRHNMFFGEGLAGELRFVFGVLDLEELEESTNACSGLFTIDEDRGPKPPRFDGLGIDTVILEYAVDKKNQSEVKAWAKRWFDLNKIKTFNSEDYRKALESITESVVKANVGSSKGRPNGSALIRIRTNDSAGNLLWQLREFEIDKTKKYPVATTTKQTPSKGFQETATPPDTDDSYVLADWINDNEDLLLQERHIVPKWPPQSELHFLGGEDTHALGAGDWAVGRTKEGRVRNPVARHKMSLNTCSGCHGGETNTSFAHIEPRLSTKQATLSPFMLGFDEEHPENGLSIVRDPVDGTERNFNMLEDRNFDMAALLGMPLLSAFSFQPTGRVH